VKGDVCVCVCACVCVCVCVCVCCVIVSLAFVFELCCYPYMGCIFWGNNPDTHSATERHSQRD
jgi:hypothetical protein